MVQPQRKGAKVPNIPSQREEERLVQLRREAYDDMQKATRDIEEANKRKAEAQERWLTLSARLGR